MSAVEGERTASAGQARLLLDPRLHPLLTELARRGEAGAAELARALGKPLSSVHAQLERLLAAEVVELVGRRARAGRPVRLYRLPLPWHVPFEVTPAATLRELLGGGFEVGLQAQLDHLARLMGGVEDRWEVLLGWQNGQLSENIQTLRRSAVPRLGPVMGTGADLRLTPERAQDLNARLNALLAEFQADQDEAGERWTLTVLLTPQEPGT